MENNDTDEIADNRIDENDAIKNESVEPINEKISHTISSTNHSTNSGNIETQLVETSFLIDDNDQNDNKRDEEEGDEYSASSLSSREQRRVDIMQKFPTSYAFVPYDVNRNNGYEEEDDDSNSFDDNDGDDDCPIVSNDDESNFLIKETKTSFSKSELKTTQQEQQQQRINDSMSSFDDDSYITAQSEQQKIIDSIQTNVLQNFATEHRIFLRTILAILTERDTLSRLVLENGPKCNSAYHHSFNNKDSSACILISGPLKKASHLVRGVWRVKYAEVRRGVFSYYEDNINNDTISGTTSLKKKSLPLRASMCTCRAVKITPKLNIRPSVDCTTEVSDNAGGAVFELTVEGGPRRLWMTTCREERQAWM